MTDAEREEYRYRYLERLGLMCEDREPTPEQRTFAQQQALKEVKALNHEDQEPL